MARTEKANLIRLETTTLHAAVVAGDAAEAREQLRRGADPEFEWLSCERLLSLAAGRNEMEIAALLLGAGAETDPEGCSSALAAAAAAGYVPMLDLLVAAGASLEGEDQEGRTALEIVLEDGGTRLAHVARRLVGHGARVTPRAQERARELRLALGVSAC